MDEIRIRDLQVYAWHGVFEEERQLGQHFFVNAVLHTDLRPAGKSDDLTLSTHYGEVCDLICKTLREKTSLLIEKAAEDTAEAVLQNFPLIRSVELELRKPEAPIAHPFESVSVKIDRGWTEVFIAFGSNMGDKREHIEAALKMLKERKDMRIISVSEFIETEPYGGVEQDNFVNGVLRAETLLGAHQLLKVLNDIEAIRDRKRDIHWGPRTLDLDILLYGNEIISDEKLTIPHIDMQNRTFVLQPLAEIAPWVRHPVLGLTAAQMLNNLSNK